MPEHLQELTSLQKDVAEWLDKCTLADIHRDLAAFVVELRDSKKLDMAEFGFRVLEFAQYVEKTSVLCPENATLLTSRLETVRNFVRLLRTLFQAQFNTSLDMAVTEYIASHPDRGNRYHKVPAQFRDVKAGETRETREGEQHGEEEIGSVRHFDVHVSHGYAGEPPSGVRMNITLTHKTHRTEQRGNVTINITTFHYLISYERY